MQRQLMRNSEGLELGKMYDLLAPGTLLSLGKHRDLRFQTGMAPIWVAAVMGHASKTAALDY